MGNANLADMRKISRSGRVAASCTDIKSANRYVAAANDEKRMQNLTTFYLFVFLFVLFCFTLVNMLSAEIRWDSPFHFFTISP